SGIFILHAVFTASSVVIHISLYQSARIGADDQWHIYIPILLVAFVTSLICIGIAERKKQVHRYFVGGIFAIAAAQALLWIASSQTTLLAMTMEKQSLVAMMVEMHSLLLIIVPLGLFLAVF